MNLLPPDPNHQFGALYRVPDPRDWHLEREVRVAAQLAAGVPGSFMVMPMEDVRVVYSQNGPSCFPPDTPILMADGSERAIQDIRAGEMVITHTGKSRMIGAVFARKYQGSLLAVRVRGIKEPLLSTPEHPYRTSLAKRDAKSGDQILRPQTPEWRAARDLRAYDASGGFDYVHIGTGAVQPSLFTGDTIELESLFAPTEKLRVSLDGEQVAVFNAKAGVGTLPSRIPLTKQFARLVGLYLAEGGTAKQKAICLTFGSTPKERELAEESARALVEIFGVRAFVHKSRTRENVTRVIAYHTTLVRLFDNICGKGVATKRIHPSFYQWEPILLDALWQGFLAGDGCVRYPNEKEQKTLVTVSQELARGLFRIGLRLGYAPTLHFSDPKPSHGVKSRRRRYDIRTYASVSHTQRPLVDGAVLSAVKSIEEQQGYDGLVYNLEVEEDHSYIANFAVVHNCVANSICGAKSIEDFKDIGTWQKFDADQLYKACGGDGINGIYTDTALRYTRETGCLEPTSGKRFKIESYYFAPQSRGNWRETLAAALVATGPCVVATLVPSMFGWDSNDSMTAGYHQLMLHGYEGLGDDDYAIFLNSWSAGWGNRGFCRLRWRYLEGNDFQSNHVYGYKLVDEDDPNSIPDPPPPDPNFHSFLGRVVKVKPGKLSIVPDNFAINIKGRRVSGVTIDDTVLSFSGKVKTASEDLIVLKGEFEASLEMRRVQVQTV